MIIVQSTIVLGENWHYKVYFVAKMVKKSSFDLNLGFPTTWPHVLEIGSEIGLLQFLVSVNLKELRIIFAVLQSAYYA